MSEWVSEGERESEVLVRREDKREGGDGSESLFMSSCGVSTYLQL